MRVEYPLPYKAFRCIADQCPDTCCAGWEVDLDDEAYYRYQVVKGAFGDRIRATIREDADWKYFPLTDRGRCPFLKDDLLCEMYEKLGEDSLCQTCTEYPRYFVEVGEYEQRDMSLACPEYARLYFTQEGPIAFAQEEAWPEWECEEISEADEARRDVILARRDALIARLQSEKGSILEMTKDADLQQIDAELVTLLQTMEPIGAAWEEMAKELTELLQNTGKEALRLRFWKSTCAEGENWVTKFAVYLVYRYWIDSWFDKERDDSVLFAKCASCEDVPNQNITAAENPKDALLYAYEKPEWNLVLRSLRLLEWMCVLRFEKQDRRFSIEDFIDAAHIFSRQVEFDTDNVDKMKQ